MKLIALLIAAFALLIVSIFLHAFAGTPANFDPLDP